MLPKVNTLVNYKWSLFAGDSSEPALRYFTDGYNHKHYKQSELVNGLSSMGLITKNIDRLNG